MILFKTMHEINESSPLNQTHPRPPTNCWCISSPLFESILCCRSSRQSLWLAIPAHCFPHLGEVSVISPSGGPRATLPTYPESQRLIHVYATLLYGTIIHNCEVCISIALIVEWKRAYPFPVRCSVLASIHSAAVRSILCFWKGPFMHSSHLFTGEAIMFCRENVFMWMGFSLNYLCYGLFPGLIWCIIFDVVLRIILFV